MVPGMGPFVTSVLDAATPMTPLAARDLPESARGIERIHPSAPGQSAKTISASAAVHPSVLSVVTPTDLPTARSVVPWPVPPSSPVHRATESSVSLRDAPHSGAREGLAATLCDARAPSDGAGLPASDVQPPTPTPSSADRATTIGCLVTAWVCTRSYRCRMTRMDRR